MRSKKETGSQNKLASVSQSSKLFVENFVSAALAHSLCLNYLASSGENAVTAKAVTTQDTLFTGMNALVDGAELRS